MISGIRLRVKSDQGRDRDPDTDEDGERYSMERAKARGGFRGPVRSKGEISNLSHLGGNAEMGVEAESAQRDRRGHQQAAAAERFGDECQRDAGERAIDVEFREHRTNQIARQFGRRQHRKCGRGDYRAKEQVRAEPASEQ